MNISHLSLALLLVFTFSCAHAPKNTVTAPQRNLDYSHPKSEIKNDFKLVTMNDCSDIRTLYLELSPPPSGDFQRALENKIEPHTLLSLNVKKNAEGWNLCTRVRLYSSIKDIREQGSKSRKSEKGTLSKVTLGTTPSGHFFMEQTWFEKLKKDKLVRVSHPGVDLTFRKAAEMTDAEVADWIISMISSYGLK